MTTRTIIRRMWQFEPDDDEPMDPQRCTDCGRHVGWDIDADDDGRAIGHFTSYAYHRRYTTPTEWTVDDTRLCEDCSGVVFRTCNPAPSHMTCDRGYNRTPMTPTMCQCCGGHGVHAYFMPTDGIDDT